MKDIEIGTHLKCNYDEYYEEGDSEWRWLGAIDKADNIISLCNSLPHSSVLEIGAGEGSILKRLAELDFAEDLYALEISRTGVETIKNRGIPRLRQCSLFDGYEVPFEKDIFDLAILSHVIEHVEYPRVLLYEAARVARYIFVEVPLDDTIRLKPDFVFDRVGHINDYSRKTIRRFLQSCNLRVLSQKVTNPSRSTYVYQKGRKGLVNYYIKECCLRMMPRVATSIFGYHMSLVCEANKAKADCG